LTVLPSPQPSPDEAHAWLRLLLCAGVGRDSARALLRAFGEPQAIWRQAPSAWEAVAGKKIAGLLHVAPPDLDGATQALLQWLQAAPDHHWLPLGHPDYPSDLLQTDDPPLVLSVLGDLSVLRWPRRLAVVGSRNPTPQGADNALAFAQALGAQGVATVSGLALGIDGAAHEGALRSGAPTLAVVGTGLDRVYPARHRELAQRIRLQGAIVSEYPLGTPPLAHHFPQRNRIISALAQGTLVVEAALQSGSLITARMALEQGREVFAIPGSIHSPQSRGCHALIRQGAKLVESAHDVMDDLRWPADGAASLSASQPSDTEEHPSDLLAHLGHDPVSLDALQARCGWPTAALQAELLTLELAGQVQRLPGGLLQRRVLA
jgi:DNA processing protein